MKNIVEFNGISHKHFNDRNIRKDILDKIEANPNIIYSLSNDRLKQLIKLQEEDIEELAIKIEKLKKN